MSSFLNFTVNLKKLYSLLARNYYRRTLEKKLKNMSQVQSGSLKLEEK